MAQAATCIAASSIRAAQLRLLSQSTVIIGGGPATALAGAFLLWPQLDHLVLLGWTAAVSAWAVICYLVHRHINRLGADDAAIVRWGPVVVGCAMGVGVLWGLTGIGIYLPTDTEGTAFILFALAGASAGGVLFYGPYLPAHNAFLISCSLPFTLASLAHGSGTSLIMGAMLIVYALMLLVAARAVNRNVTALIVLQIKNAALVADLRGANDSAEDARRAAEAANRVKSRFLANMSHELRTPLNAIIGFSELIERQVFGADDTERYRDYARDIHTSGEHLLALVNDLLDLSKLEAGALELVESEVDLAEVIASCVTLVRGQADRTGIKLTEAVPPNLPLIIADELRLKQSLLNLISNAVKFSKPGGSIMIGAAPTAAGDMAITIADNGIGMDPADIPIALRPFRQIDNDLARRYQGAGLGLPLAKHYIEQHGGSLDIDSALGRGTTVTVVLPRARVLDRPAAASA